MINVNQMKSPDRNTYLQRLNVYYTVPVKANKSTERNNLSIIYIYN